MPSREHLVLKLIQNVLKNHQKELGKVKQTKDVSWYFADKKLVDNVAHILKNYKNNAESCAFEVERILLPYAWDNNKNVFKEEFGINDLEVDISLYLEKGYLFSHYEFTSCQESNDNWKLEETYGQLDKAFLQIQKIEKLDARKHHITKIYSKRDKGLRCIGRRMFPTSVWYKPGDEVM